MLNPQGSLYTGSINIYLTKSINSSIEATKSSDTTRQQTKFGKKRAEVTFHAKTDSTHPIEALET